MNNSLTILAQSLEKKIDVLKRIQQYNEEQEKCFAGEEPDLESFDAAMEEKDALIDELLRLDEGFESLYANLKEELDQNRSKYATEIKGLQEQIKVVTALSNNIQIKEARNKKLIEDYFAKRRGGIKSGRQQSRAAYDYYKNMSGGGFRESNLWDTKQ